MLWGGREAISRSPVSCFARQFSRSPRLPVVTSLENWHLGELAAHKKPVWIATYSEGGIVEMGHAES